MRKRRNTVLVLFMLLVVMTPVLAHPISQTQPQIERKFWIAEVRSKPFYKDRVVNPYPNVFTTATADKTTGIMNLKGSLTTGVGIEAKTYVATKVKYDEDCYIDIGFKGALSFKISAGLFSHAIITVQVVLCDLYWNELDAHTVYQKDVVFNTLTGAPNWDETDMYTIWYELEADVYYYACVKLWAGLTMVSYIRSATGSDPASLSVSKISFTFFV